MSQSAVAAGYNCLGTVNDVAVLPDGSLAIGEFYDASTPDYWLYLCNVNVAANGGNGAISTTICKSWQATLLTAQATGKKINIWFSDTLSCGTHPQYTVADITFGPALEN
ncbi:hypothetical protein [Dyella mobilis]|uniref:Uncharacterized protein n=1 Tax=Dyella mobilis TaxID=1849582 RepID=A0ABS2KC98_9GAMM|nr:hypothetical protein [Dyella mobilis]MBM7128792.1 hypothetical protein [Dyella mobilis]